MPDDNIDTITKRLQVYHKQTAPLRDYYTNKGSFHPIDGNRTVDGFLTASSLFSATNNGKSGFELLYYSDSL